MLCVCCIAHRSNAEVQASSQFAKLRASYDKVDLDAWVPYIDQAVTTANAINAMRTPATNPFTLTLKNLNGVMHTTQRIRGSLLNSLSTSVQQFNGLWHNNASVAFQVSPHCEIQLQYSYCQCQGTALTCQQHCNASEVDWLESISQACTAS